MATKDLTSRVIAGLDDVRRIHIERIGVIPDTAKIGSTVWGSVDQGKVRAWSLNYGITLVDEDGIEL